MNLYNLATKLSRSKFTLFSASAIRPQVSAFASNLQQTVFISSKPSKPPTSFLLYMKECQPSKPKHLSQSEFSKLKGQHWKELSENAKKPYIRKQQQLLEDYKLEKEKFLEQATDSEIDEISEKFQQRKLARQKRKKNKDEKSFNKPKLPLTGYQYFVKTQFPRYFIKSVEDTRKAVKNIAEEWKQMSDSLKNRYHNRAQDDKKRYEQEMVEYVARLKEAQRDDLLPFKLRQKKKE